MNTRHWRLWLSGLFSLLTMAGAHSQAMAGVFGDLPARARDAAGEFRPISSQDVAEAKSELKQATDYLDAYLDSLGADGQSLRAFVTPDRLTRLLSGDVPPAIEELTETLALLASDREGLEKPVFARVRTTLRRYRNRLGCVDDVQLPEQYAARLEKLAALMESFDSAPGPRCFDEITQQLAWLDKHEQVPWLVAAVRAPVSSPNVFLTASQPFITAVTNEPVDRVDPVTDCVLGTSVRGVAHTTGTMEAFPVSSDGDIRLEAKLRGDSRTEGCGSNGPVRAKLIGTASVFASGEVLFGMDGFRIGDIVSRVSATGSPVSMWTTCRSRLVSGVITWFARRRSAKTQQKGDYIASRHAEQRLNRQLNDELNGRVEGIQQTYLSRFRHPLLRRDAFPSLFSARSESGGAQIHMLMATTSQLGAPEPPPPLPDNAAFSLKLHQTAIDNLAASSLVGKTVSELEIRECVGQLMGHKSDKPDVDEKKVLYITFADQRPASFQVDDQVVTVKLRARHFIVNRTTYDPMNITLRYRVEKTSHRVTATQVGEPEITPTRFEEQGPGRLGAREIALRRLLRNMLERELEQEYEIGKFVLPDPAVRFGEMMVSALVADDGWLAFSASGVGSGSGGESESPRGDDVAAR